jgi:tetratricopeptide (TPR) repeat protein
MNSRSTAYAQYLKGITEYHLRKYPQAQSDFEKAISKDKMLMEAYLGLAKVQLISKETQFAIENCNFVISNNAKDTAAYFLRSRAYAVLRDFTSAIADISYALQIDSINTEYYIRRAEYYISSLQYSAAIQDLTRILNSNLLNTRALFLRGEAYERAEDADKAVSDYSILITLQGDDQSEQSVFLKQRIFELKREHNRPEITLTNPFLNDNLVVLVPDDSRSITINASITDESPLQFFRINNDTILNNPQGTWQKEFHTSFSFTFLDYITLSAVDVYGNAATVSYTVEGIETQSPDISLFSPYPNMDSLIVLNDNDKYLYLEGQIEDENLISSIYIEDITASYAPRDLNPRFTATIDISKKNKISLVAEDVFGNTSEKVFYIQRNSGTITDKNPMGKTWAILIENSEYKDFPNLYSPQKDIELMQQALSRYQINKVIVKRNLTKREMERFFSIDLRDLVRANNVNSLFIWFAGHGRNIQGTGYWIPADANTNDEFSFFNINALKASLYSYTSLTHTLVVSDACETGKGFCLALRGPIEEIACTRTDLANKKSAQVYTSAGTGYAYDNSFFSRAFANALLNNEDDCSSIEDIVSKVNLIMQTNTTQVPEFGRIPGLTDDLGTFFFFSY